MTAAQAYDIPYAAEFETGKLARNTAWLRRLYPDRDHLLQATAASHNMPLYNPKIRRPNYFGDPDTIDRGTKFHNYGRSIRDIQRYCFPPEADER